MGDIDKVKFESKFSLIRTLVKIYVSLNPSIFTDFSRSKGLLIN